MKTRSTENSRRKRWRVGIGSIALGVVAGLGAVGVFTRPLGLPQSLQKPSTASEIELTTNSFVDDRSVVIALDSLSNLELQAPRAGRVTAFTCAVGSSVSSGASFISLDGVAILALATDVPLWRDLAVGDRGDDVRSLQRELLRLGYELNPDGQLGEATMQIARQAMRKAGIEIHGSIPLSHILWIPAPSVVFHSCDSPLGAFIQAGENLGSLSSAGQSVVVKALPRDLVPGARVVRIADLEIPIDETGRSVTTLSALESSALSSSRDDSRDADEPIRASLLLAHPIQISSVPPSAIFGIKGTQGCVRAQETVFHVNVVGSQLGQAFVDFGGSRPPKKVDLHPKAGAQCR
jgi:peptidoglycan hydrolase-like protein with peptidoglycan-binding domain